MDRRTAFLFACFQTGDLQYDGESIREKIIIAFEKDPATLISFLPANAIGEYFYHLSKVSNYTCDEVRAKLVMNDIEFSEEEEKILYNHIEKCQNCVDWILETGNLKLDFSQFTNPNKNE